MKQVLDGRLELRSPRIRQSGEASRKTSELDKGSVKSSLAYESKAKEENEHRRDVVVK